MTQGISGSGARRWSVRKHCRAGQVSDNSARWLTCLGGRGKADCGTQAERTWSRGPAGSVPRRSFGSFPIAGKGTRPAGRNSPAARRRRNPPCKKRNRSVQKHLRQKDEGRVGEIKDQKLPKQRLLDGGHAHLPFSRFVFSVRRAGGEYTARNWDRIIPDSDNGAERAERK